MYLHLPWMGRHGCHLPAPPSAVTLPTFSLESALALSCASRFPGSLAELRQATSCFARRVVSHAEIRAAIACIVKANALHRAAEAARHITTRSTLTGANVQLRVTCPGDPFGSWHPAVCRACGSSGSWKRVNVSLPTGVTQGFISRPQHKLHPSAHWAVWVYLNSGGWSNSVEFSSHPNRGGTVTTS